MADLRDGVRRQADRANACATIPPRFGPVRGLPTYVVEEILVMARACAICGKVSMGGFNPQSSGMNRVRAHRRYQPNLQPLVVTVAGKPEKRLVCTRCRRTLNKNAQ